MGCAASRAWGKSLNPALCLGFPMCKMSVRLLHMVVVKPYEVHVVKHLDILRWKVSF